MALFKKWRPPEKYIEPEIDYAAKRRWLIWHVFWLVLLVALIVLGDDKVRPFATALVLFWIFRLMVRIVRST